MDGLGLKAGEWMGAGVGPFCKPRGVWLPGAQGVASAVVRGMGGGTPGASAVEASGGTGLPRPAAKPRLPSLGGPRGCLTFWSGSPRLLRSIRGASAPAVQLTIQLDISVAFVTSACQHRITRY